jgi:iron complex outermembrane receptor protein
MSVVRPSLRNWLAIASLTVCSRAVAQGTPLDAGVPDLPGDAAVLAPEPLVLPLARGLDAAVASPLPIDAIDVEVRHRRAAGPGEFERGGTASKMGVPLEETAATLHTVDSKQLAERGVVDLSQAMSLVPGVNAVNSYGSFLFIMSRGFQAVPMFDGRRDVRAYALGSTGAPYPGLYDLDRIEVLRGPSSVLYGFGAVGGVVNLIRKRPSPLSAHEIELGFGLPEQYRAHVGSQGAITNKLSYRVDLGHVTHENFRRYRTERSQATVTLRYRPTSRDTLSVRTSLSHDLYNNEAGIPTIEDPKRPGRWVLPPNVQYDNRYNSRNDRSRYTRLELVADYRRDLLDGLWLELHGSISRDNHSYLAAENLTYVPATATTTAQVKRGYLWFDRQYRPIYAAAELHAEFDTGPLSHHAVAGYSLLSSPTHSNSNRLNGATPGDVSFVHPVDNAAPVEEGRNAIQRRRFVLHSVYLFDHIELLEGLILTGGGRADMLRGRARYQPLDLETQREIPNVMTGEYYRANVYEDRAFTGSLGLVAHPWQPLFAYVGYSTAYQPFFAGPQDATVIKYTPEKSQQFEGGLRVRVDEKRHVFELNAAGYLIRKKNLLVPRGMDDFAQAGLAQSRGLDISAMYRAPAYVQIDGGYALTDARYEKFIGSNPVTGNKMDDFSGNELQNVPRHMANVWLRLLPTDNISLGVGSRMVGSYFADDLNRLRLPSYALLDASLSFSTERLTFILSANNLVGRVDYFVTTIRSGTVGPQVTPGAGREVLATVRLKL